jgi:cysteine desulfurase
MRTLRDRLLDRLRAAVADLVVHGDTGIDGGLPNTLHAAFPGIEGESAVLLLDARGVECSTGSACHAASSRPSHVLDAIGLPVAEARASLRFSLSPTTTDDEIDEAARIVAEVVGRLREVSPR